MPCLPCSAQYDDFQYGCHATGVTPDMWQGVEPEEYGHRVMPSRYDTANSALLRADTTGKCHLHTLLQIELLKSCEWLRACPRVKLIRLAVCMRSHKYAYNESVSWEGHPVRAPSSPHLDHFEQFILLPLTPSTPPCMQPPGDSICLVQYGLIKVSVPFDGGKPGAASSGPASAKPAVADSKAASDKGGHKRNLSSSSSKSSKGGGSNSSSSGANKKGSKQSKSKSKATQGKAPANCWLYQDCNKSPCGCSPNQMCIPRLASQSATGSHWFLGWATPGADQLDTRCTCTNMAAPSPWRQKEDSFPGLVSCSVVFIPHTHRSSRG